MTTPNPTPSAKQSACIDCNKRMNQSELLPLEHSPQGRVAHALCPDCAKEYARALGKEEVMEKEIQCMLKTNCHNLTHLEWLYRQREDLKAKLEACERENKIMREALESIPSPAWVCWAAETENNCSCSYHKAQKALSRIRSLPTP